MSHTYPLAANADAALRPDAPAVRTRSEADALGERLACQVVALETDWLTVTESEAETILARADAAVGQGFVQRYEDEAGRPVLAVTYWKISEGKPGKIHESGSDGNAKADEQTPAIAATEDHTDDLYFRGGRTRRRRKKPADPRQMDLFSGPDQQGYERRDPDNPDIVLTEEEGDGTVFGGQDE